MVEKLARLWCRIFGHSPRGIRTYFDQGGGQSKGYCRRCDIPMTKGPEPDAKWEVVE